MLHAQLVGSFLKRCSESFKFYRLLLFNVHIFNVSNSAAVDFLDSKTLDLEKQTWLFYIPNVKTLDNNSPSSQKTPHKVLDFLVPSFCPVYAFIHFLEKTFHLSSQLLTPSMATPLGCEEWKYHGPAMMPLASQSTAVRPWPRWRQGHRSHEPTKKKLNPMKHEILIRSQKTGF